MRVPGRQWYIQGRARAYSPVPSTTLRYSISDLRMIGPPPLRRTSLTSGGDLPVNLDPCCLSAKFTTLAGSRLPVCYPIFVQSSLLARIDIELDIPPFCTDLIRSVQNSSLPRLLGSLKPRAPSLRRVRAAPLCSPACPCSQRCRVYPGRCSREGCTREGVYRVGCTTCQPGLSGRV